MPFLWLTFRPLSLHCCKKRNPKEGIKTHVLVHSFYSCFKNFCALRQTVLPGTPEAELSGNEGRAYFFSKEENCSPAVPFANFLLRFFGGNHGHFKVFTLSADHNSEIHRLVTENGVLRGCTAHYSSDILHQPITLPP